MERDLYTVYMHISPSGKRYIGVTRNTVERRWQNGYGYKTQDYFYKAIKKYGWDNFEHLILYEGLTEEEAVKCEIELIEEYKSNNRDYGYNIDSGGNGVGRFSEEHKRKIKEARIGKKHTEEAKIKMSQTKKEKYKDPNNKKKLYGRHLSEEQKENLKRKMTGRKHTKEAKEKMSKARTGKYFRPINQYDLNGNLIKRFDGVVQASEETGINKNSITKCWKREYYTAGSYIWRVDGDVPTSDELDMINRHQIKGVACRKSVAQFDKEGNFIAEYPSIQLASCETGVNVSGISACCNGRQETSGGFVWRRGDGNCL